ncbi:MAG: 30S ribosomal protein S6 [Coriobacteriia bacterium]|nr:30S ribosomal protein S6 [Coriobacteriia bacterium]
MKAYELLLMLKPNLDDEARAAFNERAQALVVANGGVLDNADDWGKRKLAYEIDKFTDAYYTLVEFHNEPTEIAEIDRVLRISDAVVRFMIVRRDDKK